MRLDLIDEFRLDLHPYVAGECTQSFDDVARSYRVRSAPSGSHCVWLGALGGTRTRCLSLLPNEGLPQSLNPLLRVGLRPFVSMATRCANPRLG